jgi:hypothetical protein
MKKNSASALLAGLMLLTVLHCKEVFEKSLDKVTMTLSAPTDRAVADSGTQYFSWQSMDSGVTYELQLVSPGFDSISRLVADTTIQVTLFPYLLGPGRYQWRVRAFNSSSTTIFSNSRSLTIQ